MCKNWYDKADTRRSAWRVTWKAAGQEYLAGMDDSRTARYVADALSIDSNNKDIIIDENKDWMYE